MKREKMEKEIKRETHILDAKDQILGRFATKCANLLRGKNKIGFQFHQDFGDYVIVKNAAQIKVTGKKLDQKIYYRHSGYLGGLKQTKLAEMIEKKPEEVIRSAVAGMLPKNKLRQKWLKRLTIYKGEIDGRKGEEKEIKRG